MPKYLDTVLLKSPFSLVSDFEEDRQPENNNSFYLNDSRFDDDEIILDDPVEIDRILAEELGKYRISQK
jgi:hypothetical protein